MTQHTATQQCKEGFQMQEEEEDLVEVAAEVAVDQEEVLEATLVEEVEEAIQMPTRFATIAR